MRHLTTNMAAVAAAVLATLLRVNTIIRKGLVGQVGVRMVVPLAVALLEAELRELAEAAAVGPLALILVARAAAV